MNPRFKEGDRVVYWGQDGSCQGCPPVWAKVWEILPHSKTFNGPCFLLIMKDDEESWEELEEELESGELFRIITAVGGYDLSNNMETQPEDADEWLGN